jgi:hypothetical protein
MVDKPHEMSPAGRLVWVWGIGGTCLLLVDALVRLAPLAWEALSSRLSAVQWVILVFWVLVMAYAEGYRGFQLRFSPRVVARSAWLARSSSLGLRLGAPFVAMGLFHASRRRKVATWVLVLGIIGLILLIRQLDQPWRGIVDAGVVVGLGWGLIATLWHAALDLAGHPPTIALDLPGEDPGAPDPTRFRSHA